MQGKVSGSESCQGLADQDLQLSQRPLFSKQQKHAGQLALAEIQFEGLTAFQARGSVQGCFIPVVSGILHETVSELNLPSGLFLLSTLTSSSSSLQTPTPTPTPTPQTDEGLGYPCWMF